MELDHSLPTRAEFEQYERVRQSGELEHLPPREGPPGSETAAPEPGVRT